MALVPFREIGDAQRQQAERYIGQVLNFHRVVAHSPEALDGFLGLSNALRKMSLDRRLRELAYLRSAQVNGCHY
jgi:alkylhydroperoxidase family enzyme